MDITLSAELGAFQDQVRHFLAENLSDEMREAARLSTTILADHALTQEWHKVLYRQGWAAPNWPVEHGGPGWTPMQRYLFEEEMNLAGAPRVMPFGAKMVGP
ncbi:MAG: acyl-CoA dehydrogenase family protein, partial [Alphaproteobacteria bacterium]|nr:acyl-CoA dehydrogenase family protein [Alphaproteobacteria bacterium]